MRTGYFFVQMLLLNPTETRPSVLNILSVCKAKDGSGVVPLLTDDNAADGKIGSAVTIVTVRMEY